MKLKKDPQRDAEIDGFVSGLKGKLDDERVAFFKNSLATGFELRNELFETAGIDKSILEKLEKTVGKEDSSLADIFNLLAPELRKAFSVEPDPENAEPGQIKLKKSDVNLFDDIGMSNEKLAEFLTTFTKCYQDDKDEDWHHLNQLMLGYVDKFFAPAYKKAEEAGLLEDDENENEK